MASALLANQNEPANWTMAQPRRGGSKMMGDVSFSNPKFSKKRQFHALTSQPLIDVDESPALMQPTVSDDASSINRRPSGNGGGRYGSSGCVTFNVASYSHKELIELKFRLVAELEQIRRLKSRIEGSDFAIRSNPNLQTKKPIKKLTGNKRSFPASKRDNTQLMKNCSQILSKLMKHKHGRYIFNSPVDVVGLQLHDYYDIIKHPMDLGTVKTRLGKNLYGSPQDFAADVRLTFDNAMKYNPKGHEVYVLAEQLLSRFEELFRPIQEKLGDDDDRGHEIEEVHEVQASSWDHSHSRVGGGGEMDWVRRDQENANQIEPTSGSTQNQNHNQNQSQNVQSTSQLPVRTPSPVRAPPVKPVKQPKPKAKDPNKREMTLEEKHKLGLGLQSLPQEKMEQVVQIIRKRNGDLRQDGDEIELDIETVDTETLWELDRFVANYKKMVSKIKRQSLMGINNNVVGNPATENGSNKDEIENERVEVPAEAKKPRKGDAGDEDVDIGDEMPMSSFPPVEIEKDNGNASSSSSSSGSSSDGSSSSSDSDSGSSSGSDSEDAHS